MTQSFIQKYLALELTVIPLKNNSKQAAIKWRDYQTTKPTPEDYKKWFPAKTTKGVAIICGETSNNLFVLDLDQKDLERILFPEFDTLLEKTLVIRTGSGKIHIYFRALESFERIQFKDKEGKELLSIRSQGSYVVAPPSIHPDTKQPYEIISSSETIKGINDYKGFINEIENLLLEKKLIVKSKQRKRSQSIISEQQKIIEGDRNNSLFVQSCNYRKKGLILEETTALLYKTNNDYCNPPLSEREVDTIVKSAYQYESPTEKDNDDILAVLKDPLLVGIIQDEFNKLGVVNEEKNRLIVLYVFIGAKLLDEPIGVIFLGASSSGKSFLTKSCQINFPPGYETKTIKKLKKIGKDEKEVDTLFTDWKEGFGYVDVNEMTSASLHRIGIKQKSFFNNKVIIMPELPQKPSDDQIQVHQLFRILISEGKISKTLTIEGESVLIELEGHPAFISADANLKVDNQLMNRTLLLNPDEGFKQTKAILIEQGKLEEEPWLSQSVMKASAILSNIHPFLEKYEVVNLWGTDIGKFMSKLSHDPQLRRTNKLILKFVRLRTLLFQYQRDKVIHKENPDTNYLLATREDVIETMLLLSETIMQTLTKVMETALGFLKDIKENDQFWQIIEENYFERKIPREFTYTEFADFKKSTYKTVYPHLKSLVYSGLLILNDKSKPHKLQLNVDRKTAENFSLFLRENLERSFDEKSLPEPLINISVSSVQEGIANTETQKS